MKKGFVIVMMIVLAACSPKLEEKTLKEFYTEASIHEVEQLIIVDGSTGYQKVIQSPPVIQQLMEQIDEIAFIPQANQEARSGWRYNVTLIDGEHQFQFALRQIGNVYYETSPDLTPIIDTFYKNVESEE